MRLLVPSAAGLLLLSTVAFLSPACAEQTPDLAGVLSAADWSKMESVSVAMTEYAFSPSTIVLKEGTPTRVVLNNAGKAAHYFVAERFFRSIATRKIQDSNGEIKAPYFTAVEVYPGKTVEWFLVPVQKGVYDLLCTVKGHAEHGMKGTIEVR
ncbi:MAG: cupredoxin domain-containing protein [Deltaproteobacteria bacterium]